MSSLNLILYVAVALCTYAYLFLPDEMSCGVVPSETIVAILLHLMVLFCKVVINYISKHHFLVLLFCSFVYIKQQIIGESKCTWKNNFLFWKLLSVSIPLLAILWINWMNYSYTWNNAFVSFSKIWKHCICESFSCQCCFLCLTKPVVKKEAQIIFKVILK